MSEGWVSPVRFPVSIFDWASTGLDLPMICDFGADRGVPRFGVDVAGLWRAGDTAERAEVFAWRAHHERFSLPVPSLTGLVLEQCPECGRWDSLVVTGLPFGFLSCGGMGCRWTEVGFLISGTVLASAFPWPKGTRLKAYGDEGFGYRVSAQNGRDWQFDGFGGSYEAADTAAFERYFAGIGDVY